MPLQDFEQSLSSFLERRLGSDVPENLAASIRYSLLAPGKRIRPRLALASAQMLDLNETAALAVAASIEMIHCFTLIHDDLPCLDNDDFRRGQPSNHKKFDEATALLAGDALMAMAFETLMEAQDHVDPRALLMGMKRLTQAVGPHGVIGGQAAESLLTPKSTLEDLHFMHARKTGALFEAALLIPKDLAGGFSDRNLPDELDLFAKELGSAFQVADDVLDADQDSGRSPTSILSYVGEAEARSTSFRQLTQACASLKSRWQERSRPLIEIAEEVLKVLSKAL
jgi:geranylgeranyl diphosphate synthase type II